MITHYDEFSGIGGFSDGARFVPGVQVTDAANHDPDACEQHALNFPHARHYREDVTKLDMTKMPRVDLFTGSPACPSWTTANGVKRDFDRRNAEDAVQEALFDMPGAKPDDPAVKRRAKRYKRERLLMWEPITYLRAMIDRDPRKPVLIGVIENVIQCRLWDRWDEWLGEFHKLGYKTRLIAISSAHARPVRAPRVGQARNRLFLAFWHVSLGRDPDWDKWLRPRAFCPRCCQVVEAVQQFKKPGADMGMYGSQYIYRCPNRGCAGERVWPEEVAALTAIDLSRPGVRIGDRERLGMPALKPATRARIGAGMQRHWAPLLAPAPVDLPPLLVPVEARAERTRCDSAAGPARTMTTRAETGLALPFIATLRGGGSRLATRCVTAPAGAVTASGNHHGLAMPPAFLMRNQTPRGGESRCTPLTEPARTVTASSRQSLVTLADALLVPYYGATETAQPAGQPCGALTTRARYGLATPDGMWLTELPDLDDVLFRMLDDDEIGKLMGFGPHFRNEARSKRTRVRLFGNAVVPAVAEVIVSALVEAMTGETLQRDVALAA